MQDNQTPEYFVGQTDAVNDLTDLLKREFHTNKRKTISIEELLDTFIVPKIDFLQRELQKCKDREMEALKLSFTPTKLLFTPKNQQK